jgi:hypothetical protein
MIRLVCIVEIVMMKVAPIRKSHQEQLTVQMTISDDFDKVLALTEADELFNVLYDNDMDIDWIRED